MATLGEDAVLVSIKRALDYGCKNDEEIRNMDNPDMPLVKSSHCEFDERSEFLTLIDALRGYVAKAYKCELDLLIGHVTDGVTILYNICNLLSLLTIMIHYDTEHGDDP